VVIVPGIALVIYYRLHQPRYSDWKSQRETVIQSNEPIGVAIVWPREASGPSSFVRGIQLAVAEINDRNGVPLTADDGTQYWRKLLVRYFDEQATKTGISIARQIASDPQILAVVGHDTESVIPASIIYHSSGVLFVVPTNMDRRVTLHRFDNVYRTAPRYRQVAQAMVDSVAQILPPKRIRLAVLYPSVLTETSEADVRSQLTFHANSIIEPFGDRASFEVVFAQSYQRGQSEYGQEVAPLLAAHQLFDVVLIMDVLPDSARLRRQLDAGFEEVERGLTMKKRILALNDMDWSSTEELYVDFSPERSESFYREVVGFVLRETKQKVVVLASRDSYGTTLGARIRSSISGTFDHPVHQLSLDMYRSYYTKATSSYMPLAADVQQRQVACVFVAGAGPATVKLIGQLREAGMDRPIVCGPSLEAALIANKKLDPLVQSVRSIIDQWLVEDQG